MRGRSLPFAFAILAALAAARQASAVTLWPAAPSLISADASDGVGAFVVEFSEITSVPASATVTAVDGNSRSTSTYSFSDSGLTLTFDHSRATRLDSYAGTFVWIRLSVSSRVDYAVAGAYSTDAVEGGWTALDVAINDLQTTPALYRSRQESFATPMESFVLGESGGDANNILVGSPTGALLRGHIYDLDIGIHIDASPTAATSIARGTGYVTLLFVPEPSSALLVAAGLVAFAMLSGRIAPRGGEAGP